MFESRKKTKHKQINVENKVKREWEIKNTQKWKERKKNWFLHAVVAYKIMTISQWKHLLLDGIKYVYFFRVCLVAFNFFFVFASTVQKAFDLFLLFLQNNNIINKFKVLKCIAKLWNSLRNNRSHWQFKSSKTNKMNIKSE